MQRIFERLRNSAEEENSEQSSTIDLQLDDEQLEQIKNTRKRNINPKI